jgi:hypothetical protein
MSHSTVPSCWSGSKPVSASIQSGQKMVSTARPQQRPASGRIKATREPLGLSPAFPAPASPFRLRVSIFVRARLLDGRERSYTPVSAGLVATKRLTSGARPAILGGLPEAAQGGVLSLENRKFRPILRTRVLGPGSADAGPVE